MSSMVVKQHENMMKGMMVTDLNMGTFTKEEVLRAYDEMGRMTSRIELLSPPLSPKCLLRHLQDLVRQTNRQTDNQI